MLKPKHTPSDENSILILPDKVSVPAQTQKVKWRFVIGSNKLRLTDIVFFFVRGVECVCTQYKSSHVVCHLPHAANEEYDGKCDPRWGENQNNSENCLNCHGCEKHRLPSVSKLRRWQQNTRNKDRILFFKIYVLNH